MAIYSTLYGLPQSMVDYLNQPLPDISNLYTPPVAGIYPNIPSPDDPEGIVSLYPQISGDGPGYSVYNPDPTRVSGPIDMSQSAKPTNIYNYQPGSFEDDYYNRLAEKGILEYGTADYFPQKSGIETLMDTIKNNPIIQGALTLANPLTTAIKGIGTGIAGMLPVNERAIQEKALRQMGYSIDDVGRIVQGSGDYLTPENIMSGYNAYRMTPETFDKRIESILNRSLPQTEASRAKIAAIQQAKQDFLDAQKLTQTRYQAQVRSKYAKELAAQKAIEDAAKSRRDFQGLELTGIRTAEAARASANRQEAANREAARQAGIEAARASAAAQEAANRDAARQAGIEAARASANRQEAANREAARQAGIEAARQSAIAQEAANREAARGGGGDRGGRGDQSGGRSSGSGESGYGGFCFDPNTPIQMADGSEKKIKDIQLGDDTKGGEVTGVFQFKATDEIHDYKGVTVAGSHYVKEDGKFIMVKDSLLSVKIDKIPVVYSLDTTGRRIFINDIEFADYNGDGIAKGFLENAGVDLAGFDKEVLRQVEHRLI